MGRNEAFHFLQFEVFLLGLCFHVVELVDHCFVVYILKVAERNSISLGL